MTSLRFPDLTNPEISIVMVTHGAWDWTRRALAALRERTPPCYEVIVIDNASPDGTLARLAAETIGVKLVANDNNAGFGPASNQGAELAQGSSLVFLNNDAIVHDGWLEPLFEAVAEGSHAAAAVPRFLNLDGSLQEAGALVARDGTVAQYGFGDDPQAPQYRFRRTVDYGGGACLLVRRDAFEIAGGFHPSYAPAYYEDADLCFALAARGQRTVYEPRAVVTHARYASGAPSSAAALSQRHRQTFVARWGDALAGRPATLDPPHPRAILEARDFHARDRILLAGEQPGAEPLVATLAMTRSDARLTWLLDAPLQSHDRSEALLASGVELAWPVADRVQWLAERRLHYDTTIAAADDDPDLELELAASQPQALRMTLSELRNEPELHRPAGTRPAAGSRSAARAASSSAIELA
jgi:GT2 family glycosyltransferase